MASDYSDRVRLEKQGSGENANTWGDRLNTNVIDLVDVAVAGVTAVDVDGLGGTGITLSENNGDEDIGRHAALRFSGALTADCTVSYTANEKIYFVNNETTGDHKIIMDNGNTKVSVAGGSALIATQGSNSFTLRDFEPGTRLAFNQNHAPVGWSIVTSGTDNAALRIVNAATSGGKTGGSNGFTSVFNSGITVSITGKATHNATLGGSTAGTALSVGQMPRHSHHGRAYYLGSGGNHSYNLNSTYGDTFYHENSGHTRSNNANTFVRAGVCVVTAGSGASHSHSLAGQGSHSHTVSLAQANAFNLNVKHVDFIVCEKD